MQAIEHRRRAIGGAITLITATSGPSVDQRTALLLGLKMWSMLHGHLRDADAGHELSRPRVPKP